MELGSFSVSLAVKDIKKSKMFYEKLGFKQIGGDLKQNWLILQNKSHVIGLFQGMFEKNMLTFNPGWNQNGKNLTKFTDIRIICKQLKELGLKIVKDIDSDSGPASIMLEDPDGNSILIDQHR